MHYFTNTLILINKVSLIFHSFWSAKVQRLESQKSSKLIPSLFVHAEYLKLEEVCYKVEINELSFNLEQLVVNYESINKSFIAFNHISQSS